MPATLALTSTLLGIATALLLIPAAGFPTGQAQRSCPEPSSLSAIRSVPESQRARCFGDQPISFQAWGWDLANVWPGLEVPAALGTDFVLAKSPKGTGLAAFRPPTVVVPDPAGTPWENQDGIAPGDAWWRVTGHFDDPLAVLCQPTQGDIVNGVPVELSDRQATEFCRNHFVIERLTWLPDGPPETATAPAVATSPSGASGVPSALVVAAGLAGFTIALRRWPARGARRDSV